MDNISNPVVLCIDDNKDQLVLIKRWLTAAGYDVLTAGGADEAVQVLSSRRPDLILLDVVMPGTDGYSFCARLQATPAVAMIPVVFLTALFSRQDKARALAVGGVDFLVKPVKQERLIETVSKTLQAMRNWSGIHTKKPSFADFRGFLTFLQSAFNVSPESAKRLAALNSENLYHAAPELKISDAVIAQNMAKFLEIPYVASIEPSDVELGVLPTSFCKARKVIPIVQNGEKSFIVANPFAFKLIDDISSLFGSEQKPRILVTEPANIKTIVGEELVRQGTLVVPAGKTAMLGIPQGKVSLVGIPLAAGSDKERTEASAMSAIEAKLVTMYKPEEETVVVNEDSEAAAPVILLVNKIIDDAIECGASDIHIEPWEREVVVRCRIDGDLKTVKRLQPQKLNLPIIARIKIMSNLSITERRLPQDGRIGYKDGIDLRVATTPTNFGEKAVLRLLDKKKSAQPLDTLGFSTRNLQTYREKIQTPYGLILHVGPTGSGKSMTLFAALKEIQTPEINIQTIEDPIEYTLAGISQVQVNLAAGLTFARGLRGFLRQDPDVILVGEIRDRETADVAVEAALTGHLVLSTLHTNDSSTTVTRLIEMGVEPYLVSSSTIMICAQRLLRRLCTDCKHAWNATPDEKRMAGLPADKDYVLYSPGKCDACGQAGYKGRIGVHELLVMNDALRSAMTTRGMTADDIKRMAVERCGMSTLYWDGIDKVRGGITSLQEVAAQIRRDDFESKPNWM